MPLKLSEAIVLRTWPLREADLLVALFTRTEGKVKGVAKSAKKSRRRFGGALEPMTRVRAQWEDRERQELARLDSCEVLSSPLADAVDYPRAVALGHVAEMLDEMLPDREANDAIFRLTWGVLDALRSGSIWMPLTYFDLWMVRLMGFLPELGTCMTCGRALDGQRAWFHAMADGLICQNDRRIASSEMSAESRQIAAQMFRARLDSLNGADWPRERGADLRKFLMQIINRHLDRRLVTTAQLEKLD